MESNQLHLWVHLPNRHPAILTFSHLPRGGDFIVYEGNRYMVTHVDHTPKHQHTAPNTEVHVHPIFSTRP